MALLLFLNLTVAIGTLNGIIFYANVAYANSSTFFQFPRTNFIAIIIAWLNLEIEIDTCFYDGMDMYWKTWLQLSFSVYLLFLIVMIIVFATFLGEIAVMIPIFVFTSGTICKILRVLYHNQSK